MNLRRVRAIFGCSKIETPLVIARATAMFNGMNGDKVTYAGVPQPLTAFQPMITDVATAQQEVATRVIGAAAVRNAKRDTLWSTMDGYRIFVQMLADKNPSNAVALIQNAGLMVAKTTGRTHALLTLKNGHASGSVDCIASIRLLMAASSKPKQGKTVNWQYTTDGSKTFINLPSTPKGLTSIANLVPATWVGVRVSVTTTTEGVGPWSDVITILVK